MQTKKNLLNFTISLLTILINNHAFKIFKQITSIVIVNKLVTIYLPKYGCIFKTYKYGLDSI